MVSHPAGRQQSSIAVRVSHGHRQGLCTFPTKLAKKVKGGIWKKLIGKKSVHSETTVYRPFSRWPGAGKQELIIDTSNGPLVC